MVWPCIIPDPQEGKGMDNTFRAVMAAAAFVAICGLFIAGFENAGDADGCSDAIESDPCGTVMGDESVAPAVGNDAGKVVATIDGVDYYTFKEAADAAKKSPSKSFTLLDDVALGTEMVKNETVDVTGLTIDFGGRIVATGDVLGIFVGTDFTLKNGTVDGSGASYGLWIGDDGTGSPLTKNVVVEKIAVKGGVNLCCTENVVLRDVAAGGIGYYAVWCDEGANVTIESGEYSSASISTTALLGISGTSASMSIVGGTFEVADNKVLVFHGESAGKRCVDPVITGGTFINIPESEHISDYVPDGYEVDEESGSVTVIVELDPPEISCAVDGTTVYVTATHPGAVELSFSVVSPGGKLVAMHGNGFNATLTGSYLITVTATDGLGHSASSSESVYVFVPGDDDDDPYEPSVDYGSKGGSDSAVVVACAAAAAFAAILAAFLVVPGRKG